MACFPFLQRPLALPRLPVGLSMALLFLTLSTVGCQPVASPEATDDQPRSQQGKVHGGQQGISGSTVQIYAVGTSGDGGAAAPLFPKAVLTDAGGGFSLQGLSSCPTSDAITYVVARGGNPGLPGGTTNDSLALMAMLGPCSALSATKSISVNEVTTIAAIWPMVRYLNGASKLDGAKGDAAFVQAIETTKQLVDTATGTSPGLGVPEGYRVPSDKVNTLANILAACVNSGGGVAGDGSTCGTLFSLAAMTGSIPVTDTITAALQIARNPTQNVAALLHLAPVSAPFEPTLSAAPTDWTLDLQRELKMPTVLPAGGSYPLGQQITMSSSSVGGVIHYTVDGTVPTTASAIYSAPLTLEGAETIRAMVSDGSASSVVATAAYAVGVPHLVFAVQPSTLAAAAAFGPAPVVEMVDATGKSMAGASTTVTLSLIQSNGGSASLTGSTTATTVSGMASFPGLSISQPGTGYTLQASVAGLAVQRSKSFDVTPAVAATQTAIGPLIPSTYFGMSVNHSTTPAPTLPYGTTRSWDADGVSWAELNPANGTFNFAALDAFVAKNQARGAQAIYTFGRTPQWASEQPNAVGSYGPGQCAPPTNLASWDNYVRAVVTHVAGKIKYWEIWNEPNNPGFYCGQVSTMITMAQHASAIIKSVDPGALVLSPALTSGSGPQWLGWYLLGGGGAFVDVIAFHGYGTTDPQAIVQIVANYRSVMAANGAASKPMWDTEVSWAGDGNLVTPDLPHQAAFVAKTYLLQQSLGISRVLWYAYDGGLVWGGLWDAKGGASSAALAYSETYRWMANASITKPCAADQTGTWTCDLARPGGYAAEAIWRPNAASMTVTVPAKYVEYRDLAGNVHAIAAGRVPLADQPILLESGPLP